ncbi:MAG: hypothetical protein ACYTAS_01805 [Planctomycetota bacterium]|jgi:hypothetical protein
MNVEQDRLRLNHMRDAARGRGTSLTQEERHVENEKKARATELAGRALPYQRQQTEGVV